MDAERLTGGEPIDLWIETTTDYVPHRNDANWVRDVNGKNIFGEINLRGPGSADGSVDASVGLSFTFIRRT